MFSCERCGSTFKTDQVRGLESCPSCLMREALSAPLAFHVFSIDTVPTRRHAVDQCRRATRGLERLPGAQGADRGPASPASRLSA